MLKFFVGEDAGVRLLWFSGSGLRTGVDPAAENVSLFRAHLAFGRRHLARFDPFQQETLIGLARDDRWAGLASFFEQSLQPHVEFRLGFVRFAVALKAVSLEDRPHMLFKCRLSRVGRECQRAGRYQQHPENRLADFHQLAPAKFVSTKEEPCKRFVSLPSV